MKYIQHWILCFLWFSTYVLYCIRELWSLWSLIIYIILLMALSSGQATKSGNKSLSTIELIWLLLDTMTPCFPINQLLMLWCQTPSLFFHNGMYIRCTHITSGFGNYVHCFPETSSYDIQHYIPALLEANISWVLLNICTLKEMDSLLLDISLCLSLPFSICSHFYDTFF